jgi:hypothetical protein
MPDPDAATVTEREHVLTVLRQKLKDTEANPQLLNAANKRDGVREAKIAKLKAQISELETAAKKEGK